MLPSPTVPGVVVQFDTPSWAPLEAAIGSELASWFMWMHELQLADGSRIHAYKHSVTRRYLHLAADGRAFDDRADGRYGEVHLASAIVCAFSGADRVLPSAQHLQAVRAAVQAARLRPAH